MASSMLRWISRKAAAAAANPRDNNSLVRGVMNVMINGGATRTMSGGVVSNGGSKSGISTPPWLMLPPAFEGNDNMVYKFYSLAENKVLNITSRSNNKFVGDHEDIEFVSSSHGWLTLFNTCNCDLFLCNPLSGRHIKLPPIRTLSIPQRNLRRGYGCVAKVITSCSPEEQDCRVMMSFGPEHRLAFCSPTTSTDWTPIGALYREEEDDFVDPRGYEHFVYSSRQKLFYCITQFEDELEAWDLQEIGSPKVIAMDFPVDEGAGGSKGETEDKFLVVSEDTGDLFIVRRRVMLYVAPDGSYFEPRLDEIGAAKLPHKTIGFDVYKYDPEKCAMVYMDGSLDGLALFIGNNHSFAVSATEFSELKPNSIYFTDLYTAKWESLPYGGHDLGIFNYEDRTFSSCYYPCDRQSLKRIYPAPMWFTPTPF